MLGEERDTRLALQEIRRTHQATPPSVILIQFCIENDAPQTNVLQGSDQHWSFHHGNRFATGHLCHLRGGDHRHPRR